MLCVFSFCVTLYLYSFLNRAPQPCPSPALLLISWGAQSPSWPRRTWTAQTRPGENSWLKVMLFMKASVDTSSPMMVSALIIDIPNNCIASPSTQTWSKMYVSNSYQEPQGKHTQPKNWPWAETHLWHDGGTHGQRTLWQGRSSLWRYCSCVNEYMVCVLVCLFVLYQDSDDTCLSLRAD